MKQSLSAESEQQRRPSNHATSDISHANGQKSFVDNRPQAAAQRQLIETINASPKMIAQSQIVDSFHNSPQMVAQRKLHNQMRSQTLQLQAEPEEAPLQGKSDPVQRQSEPEEELPQGKFEPVQRQKPEDEELLQGKFAAVQRVEEEELLQGKLDTVQRLEEEELLQGKFAAEPTAQPAPQKNTLKHNNTGLPDNLKTGIENLSGMSMDNVKVHYNSSQPAQLNAHAYAQGTDIHLAPGQEQHLPHEVWHVVQQAQGRVKPTMQMKDGIAVNDDQGLETEADLMGDKAAVQRKLESIKSDSIGFTNTSKNNSTKKITTTLNEKVFQRVGEEKIGIKKTNDFGKWRGLLFLDKAIEEMKNKRRKRKELIWKEINNLENKDNISSKYSNKLIEQSDYLSLLQDTSFFKNGILSIQGSKIFTHSLGYGKEEIASIVKGDEAFSISKKHSKNTAREVYIKDDENKHYIKDSRNVITRRYAYVEKNYWQFMEFLLTHHMEGRYQKFIRAANKGKGKPDVFDNTNEIVKKVQKNKANQLSLEQLAFVHQYWGSGSQQRGLSLTSTPKTGVTIGNEGENFRTNDGFLIKIDLAKIPKTGIGPILVNHYAHGGTKDVIDENSKTVNTNPLNKSTPYKYKSSVIKNRELYLEYLKPEWIVEIEHHPNKNDKPGIGESTLVNRSLIGNTEQYMNFVKFKYGANEYQAGFVAALAYKKLPKQSSSNYRNGHSSGMKYLEGYKEGASEFQNTRGIKGLKGRGIYKKNTKKDWSLSKHKKKKLNKENNEKEVMYVANLTIEETEDKNKTDIYRIGYIHGRMKQEKIKDISEIVKSD
ncbi:DUF4157 domain-containing protein [Nitrosomonas sp.]|uniref:eCIS core domain-containing protein n=1 Tax=Nitrosomonas sp. TaxID=42353 RepID=UPI0020872C04|nr:DUF4157 domain-containing protein [Nitrosomonas sp.]GJL74700.1 MAG: hypothetical protein NMNS02_08060 [Nitrosomonas sp.]